MRAASDDGSPGHAPAARPGDDEGKTPLPPITLGLMKLVATILADDIEAEQARRVECGWRKAPDPCELEKARVLRKIGELIDRLKASPPALAALGLRARTPAGGDAP